MRSRRRYVVFEVLEDNLTIEQTVARLCEELRADQGEIRTIVYDTNFGRGILFCPHYLLNELKEKIAEKGSKLRIIGVSGTIRAAKRKFWVSQGDGGLARGRR